MRDLAMVTAYAALIKAGFKEALGAYDPHNRPASTT
jgi:hypothetical protein